MIVISDASPVVGLSRIGRLDLLRDLYERVVVPRAVHDEICAGSTGLEAMLAAAWIDVHAVTERALVDRLLVQLDLGEAEAIALSIERRADVLLMDERRGRRIAGGLGLRVVGTLGVLIAAKQRGLIPVVAPLVADLVSHGTFRVAEDVRRRVLHAAGED